MSKQEDQLEAGTDVDTAADGEISLLRGNNKKLTDQLVQERKAKKLLEDQIEDAKAARGDELTKAQRAQQKAEAALAELTQSYSGLESKLRTVTLLNEINNTMDAAGVLPHMKEPLRAMYLAQVEWDSESASGSINGTAVSQHITKHLKGKEGAHYIAAPETGGAGAEGNTQTRTGDKWSDLSKVNAQAGNLTEYVNDALKDPEAFNSRAREQNREDLLV